MKDGRVPDAESTPDALKRSGLSVEVFRAVDDAGRLVLSAYGTPQDVASPLSAPAATDEYQRLAAKMLGAALQGREPDPGNEERLQELAMAAASQMREKLLADMREAHKKIQELPGTGGAGSTPHPPTGRPAPEEGAEKPSRAISREAVEKMLREMARHYGPGANSSDADLERMGSPKGSIPVEGPAKRAREEIHRRLAFTGPAERKILETVWDHLASARLAWPRREFALGLAASRDAANRDFALRARLVHPDLGAGDLKPLLLACLDNPGHALRNELLAYFSAAPNDAQALLPPLVRWIASPSGFPSALLQGSDHQLLYAGQLLRPLGDAASDHLLPLLSSPGDPCFRALKVIESLPGRVLRKLESAIHRCAGFDDPGTQAQAMVLLRELGSMLRTEDHFLSLFRNLPASAGSLQVVALHARLRGADYSLPACITALRKALSEWKALDDEGAKGLRRQVLFSALSEISRLENRPAGLTALLEELRSDPDPEVADLATRLSHIIAPDAPLDQRVRALIEDPARMDLVPAIARDARRNPKAVALLILHENAIVRSQILEALLNSPRAHEAWPQMEQRLREASDALGYHDAGLIIRIVFELGRDDVSRSAARILHERAGSEDWVASIRRALPVGIELEDCRPILNELAKEFPRIAAYLPEGFLEARSP